MPRPTSRKRPPLVIVLAVLVPVAALAIAAAVTSSSRVGDDASSTTLVQDGDPAAADATTTPDEGKGTTTTAADDEAGTTTTTTTRRAGDGDDDERPAGDNPGGDPSAGGEVERPTTSYPQPTVPASGCSRPSGTAVITLSDAPSPACLQLAGNQAVVFRNRTGKEISLVAIGVNEVVAPGSETRVGSALDAFGEGRSTFWSPGNPQLSGIVQVG